MAGPAPRRLLLLPLLLYLSLAGLYLWAVPPGESPDEPGHWQCIAQVAADGRLPQIDPPASGQFWYSRQSIISGRMCFHLPLYYLAAGYGLRLAGASPALNFPPSSPDGPAPAMFVQAGAAVQPAAVVALRVGGVLLGLATLWAAHRVAARLFPERPLAPLVAATLVAGWPQFLFLSRAINNDVLATALAAVLLVVLLDVGRPSRFAPAGLLAALAVLTKLTMAFAVGVLAVVFVVEWWGANGRRRAYLRAGLLGLLPLLALAVLLAWQPTLRDHLARAGQSFGGVAPAALTADYWFDVARLTLSSGYAHFGWMSLPAPFWQAWLWWGLALAAGGFGLATALQLADGRARRLLFVVLGLWAAGVAAGYLRLNFNRFQPQFRFALPLLPLLAALAGGGIARLAAGASRRTAVVVALALALAALNVWLAATVIGPAYG